jgi:putative transposase
MKRQEVAGGIRFLTFSCEHRLQLLGNPAIRDLFVTRLAAAHTKFTFDLFAWVVMPEHVHLLLRPPPDVSAEEILDSLKKSVARRVIDRWQELGAPVLARITDPAGRTRFWQRGGGFDRNVRHRGEFAREVRYIHRNPVERGLVERPTDWSWSSARWWAGDRDGQVPCDLPPAMTIEQSRLHL